MLRPRRLLRLLLLVLLAVLPLQSWAAGVAHGGGVSPVPSTHAAIAIRADALLAGSPSAPGALEAAGAPGAADPADAPVPAPFPLAEAGEPAPAGADLAEQLLPATAPRLAAGPCRAGVPGYARAALPEPHLPLPPRPPRG